MSTVIKAGQGGNILQRLSTVDLADHLAEARAVIEEAGCRADRIAAQARADAQCALEEAKVTGYQAGYERGHAEGLAAGRQEGRREAIERFNTEQDNLVSMMKRALAEIDASKEELRLAAERDVLDFAALVARRLTFAIGRLHRESAQANLCRAIELVDSKTDVTVRVHPDDLASIETFAASLLDQVGASRAVKIVSDDSVAPGGCKVESDRTGIDATLEAQVNEMTSLLLGGGGENG